jgi:hypothetical protein
VPIAGCLPGYFFTHSLPEWLKTKEGVKNETHILRVKNSNHGCDGHIYIDGAHLKQQHIGLHRLSYVPKRHELCHVVR